MPEFIARMIKKAAGDVDNMNVVKGQKKYAAYFTNLKKRIYEGYREDVDAILRADGYEDCIVED